MTKDEATKLAQIDQKLGDFIETANPILEALNGPKGWFAQMEARMKSQEDRTKAIFAIFGGLWGLVVVVFGVVAANFYETLKAIEHFMVVIK